MSDNIDIKNYFFKFNTLTKAINEAKRIGISRETFNKWKEGEGIQNWSKIQRNYIREKKKNYIKINKSIPYDNQEQNNEQELVLNYEQEQNNEQESYNEPYNEQDIDEYVKSFLVEKDL